MNPLNNKTTGPRLVPNGVKGPSDEVQIPRHDHRLCAVARTEFGADRLYVHLYSGFCKVEVAADLLVRFSLGQ